MAAAVKEKSYLLSIQATYKYYSVGGKVKVLIREDIQGWKKAVSCLDFKREIKCDSWKHICVDVLVCKTVFFGWICGRRQEFLL